MGKGECGGVGKGEEGKGNPSPISWFYYFDLKRK